MTTKVVEQMMKDQQVLAQQVEITGQAVARLTLNSTRPPVGEPPSPTVSDASTDNPFHQGPQGTSHTVLPHRHDRGGQRGGADALHRLKHALPKLAFPRFTGSNPRVWRSKCQDYFQLYNVPPAMQATFASLHMDDNAGKWLQVFKRKYGLTDWKSFISAVEEKFGAADYRDAMGELLELTQTTTVEQYAADFANLQYEICMHNEGFDDLFFVSQFVRGLRYDIGAVVQSQLPQTVDRAILLAKVQQRVLEKGKAKQQKLAGTPRQQQWPPRQDAKPGGSSSSMSKERQLLNYRKANNLCYYCGEKYEPAHVAVCSQRPKAQVNALVVNDLDLPLSEEVVAQIELEDSLTTEFCQLSLNALAGTEEGAAMKLRSLVHNKVMLTLVDSGSTHSFVSSQFLQHVGITPLPTIPTSVKLANGQVLVSDQWVPQMEWWCDGFTLLSDMKVLDIGAFDAILGFDWLQAHSPMVCDWEARTMEFTHKNVSVKLKGVQPPTKDVSLLSAEKVYKWLKGNDIWALVVVTPSQLDPPPTTDPEIDKLLETYKDVFEDPHTLPPERMYDHTISLLPNAIPVNSRPYKYSPMHKDEIERQVKDMLSAGIITPSTSPFASPVLLIQKKVGSWRFCIDYR